MFSGIPVIEAKAETSARAAARQTPLGLSRRSENKRTHPPRLQRKEKKPAAERTRPQGSA